VAGEISSSDTRSMSGIPGLGAIPGLNQAMVSNSLTTENDELLIVITPHVVANRNRITDEIWVTEN
jgi:Flp pilus assembly secretin CpaC